MFESLDDTMKHDAEASTTKKERWIMYAATLVVTVIVVGGVLFGIRMME